MAEEAGAPDSRLENVVRTKLEQLTPGARASGIAGPGRVDVIASKWIGANALIVTYRGAHGQTGQAVIRREQEPRISLGGATQAHAFDGDAESWRLAAEALRFILADDPGSGKTIMAGLYIKELMLRGDLARCLIVAPGSLVEQWQEEL